MDAQWTDEFHHALRVCAGQERAGYYSDFAGVEHLAKAYRDAYVYDGQYSVYRQKCFGKKTTAAASRFIVFAQNHDQVGNSGPGERSSKLYSFEMQKLLAAAVLLSPYIPLLFMGEEWGEPNPFLYFTDHSDVQLQEAVRDGRRREFSAFYREQEVPDPGEPGTFLSSKLQWELLPREPHNTLLQYYRELISVRKSLPVLRYPDRDHLQVNPDTEKQVLLLQRWRGDQQLLCWMNFSAQQQEVRVPALYDKWINLIDSAAPRWKGPASAPALMHAEQSLTLQPQSLLLCTNYYV